MNNAYSEVRFEKLVDMRVASYSAASKSPEEDSMAYLNKWAEKNGLFKIEGQRNFGFDISVTEEQSREGLRGYEYWLTVPEGVTGSEGVSIKEIKGDEYAVLTITDPFSDPFKLIPGGWQKLSSYVRENGLESKSFEGRYCLEEVVENDKGTFMNIYTHIK